MTRFLLVLLLAAVPFTARGFDSCSVISIAGPGASIAEEGGNPVAAGNYLYTGYTSGSQAVVFASNDRGQSFGAPVVFSIDPAKAADLRLGASDDQVYALWGARQASRGNLMFAASADRGASWTAPLDLGDYNPRTLMQLAEDGENVHVAYVRNDGEIAIRNSADAGRSFGPSLAIAPGKMEVVVESSGQNVYVAWTTAHPRIDVYVAVSHDGGNTFSVTDLSAQRPSSANEPIFALDAKSGRLSLVWRESSPKQGAYLQSLDNGDSWSAPVFIDQPTRQYMVADDGSLIYVSYLKEMTVNGATDLQVYLAISSDGGKSFAAPTNLSGPTGISNVEQDKFRPIPWVSDDGHLRLTGMEADGVHIWNGASGRILAPVYLGPGVMAAPAANGVTWQNGDAGVDFAYCR